MSSRGNHLFHLTACSVFFVFFFKWGEIMITVKKYIFFYCIVISRLVKKPKNGTGGGLLVGKIDFSIIDFFTIDYRLD